MNAATKERWRDAIGGTLAFGLFWSIIAGLHQTVWGWLASSAEQTGNWAQDQGVPPPLAHLNAKVLAFLAANPVITLGCTLLIVAALVGVAVFCERRRIDEASENCKVARGYTTPANRKRPDYSIWNRQLLCMGIGMFILLWAWYAWPRPVEIGMSVRIIHCCFRAAGLQMPVSCPPRPDTNMTQRATNAEWLSTTNAVQILP